MTQPSTAWRETIPPDEAARHERQAAQFAAMQRAKSARYGDGRALHRSQRVALRASVEVLPGIPDEARHGLFASARTFPALVRLSNGSFDRQADAVRDIRGFAVKVLGVSGAAALGGAATSQDFVLINHEHFSSPTSEDFTAITVGAAAGLPRLLWRTLRRPSLLSGLGRVRGALAKPFTGFATEDFFSAAPIACGPYAVRVRLGAAAAGPAETPKDFAADVYQRLASGPLVHELAVQFYLDDQRTPIENAAASWDSAYVTVARLTIPSQEPDEALAAEAERARFDPWSALAEHRPLGEVMRARKVAYRASQLGRD
jgi:hypothetical protein